LTRRLATAINEEAARLRKVARVVRKRGLLVPPKIADRLEELKVKGKDFQATVQETTAPSTVHSAAKVTVRARSHRLGNVHFDSSFRVPGDEEKTSWPNFIPECTCNEPQACISIVCEYLDSS